MNLGTNFIERVDEVQSKLLVMHQTMSKEIKALVISTHRTNGDQWYQILTFGKDLAPYNNNNNRTQSRMSEVWGRWDVDSHSPTGRGTASRKTSDKAEQADQSITAKEHTEGKKKTEKKLSETTETKEEEKREKPTYKQETRRSQERPRRKRAP
ncbi:hypothetical protein Tco_0548088 [Tanacetum coccineum]